MTPKQKLFCEHYLANGMNATKAAASAGYSNNRAKEIGYQLLKKEEVKQVIADTQNYTSKKLEITRESLIKDLELSKSMALLHPNKDGQPMLSSYVKACEAQAKLLGLNQEDQKNPINLKDLTDSELEILAKLTEKLTQ